LRENNAKL
jgi:hypothetical protein